MNTFFKLSFCFILFFPSSLWSFYTNQPASIVIGQKDFNSNSRNQGLVSPSSSTLNNPMDVCYDGERLFIADWGNNRVLVYNNTPYIYADIVVGQVNFSSSAANQGANPIDSSLYQPQGVWSDGVRLFISDTYNHRVLIFNQIPSQNNQTADIVIGQKDFYSNQPNQGGTVGPNTLYYPTGIYSDGTRLFIADIYNNRVLIYNHIPSTNNANANITIGQKDFSSNLKNQNDSDNPQANTLYNPTDVFSIAESTKIFIADYLNNRVLVFDSPLSTHDDSAEGVIGQTNFTNRFPATPPDRNTLNKPTRVRSDGNKLFISEQINNRILIFIQALLQTTNSSAQVVVGQRNFASSGSGISTSSLSSPWGIFVSNSKLFIADWSNHRVLIFEDLKPEINTITPNSGANNISSFNLKIYGKNFDPLATVRMKRNGLEINTAMLTIETSTSILCGFDLTGKATGYWDIEVYNPDTSFHTLVGGFLIEFPTPTISGITPSNGVNTKSVNVEISGNYFRGGVQVELTKSGETSITGNNISVISSTSIIATFALFGKTTGQ